MRVLTLDIERRIAKRLAPGEGSCLEWQGATSRGYGAMNIDGKSCRVHRIACELRFGPPPEGRSDALHTCDNRRCVNPYHLYWGNDADNARDRRASGTATGGRAGASHCIDGHEFTPENTYWEPRGWGRACKECGRRRVREYRARLKEAASQ